MKIITLSKNFLTAQGQPFRQVKRDKNGDVLWQKDNDGKILKDSQGNAIPELEVASMADTLKSFVNSVFIVAQSEKKELKMEDSSQAIDIFRAIDVSQDGTIELEKAPYEWLEKNITEYGVDILGINAAVLKEAIKAKDAAPNRAERRREEKRKK